MGWAERRETVLEAARENDFEALEKWFKAAKQEDLAESLAMPLYKAMTAGKDFGEFLKQAKQFIGKVGELHIPMNVLLMNSSGKNLELVLNALDRRLKKGEFDYQIAKRIAGDCSWIGDSPVVFDAPWLTGKDLELIAGYAKHSLEAKGRRLTWGPIDLCKCIEIKASDVRCTGDDLKVVLAASESIIDGRSFGGYVIPCKLGIQQYFASNLSGMMDFIDRHPKVVLCALSKELQSFCGVSYESREDVVKWRNNLRASSVIMGLLDGHKSTEEGAAALRILKQFKESDMSAVQRGAPHKERKLRTHAQAQARVD